MYTYMLPSISNVHREVNMEVQVHNATIINDGDPDIGQLLPLTIFDLLAPNHHVSVLFAFTPPAPANGRLIRALSETLTHFPILTARIGYDHRRRPCFLVGSAGVLVVEASVGSDLSDHLPLEPSRGLLALQPPADDGPGGRVLRIQLNRFRCGGLAVSVTSHHKAADGHSMGNFFTAWGQAARGVPIDPLPSFDLSWLHPRGEFPGWSLEFVPASPQEAGLSSDQNAPEDGEVANVLLHYSREFIATKLKPEMGGVYTTFVSLSAHVLRKMAMAQGLEDRQRTLALRISVNGRRRLNPPVPAEFFGNLVLDGCAKLKVEQLTEGGGLDRAAQAIHDAIGEIDDRYFRSVMDLGKLYAEDGRLPSGVEDSNEIEKGLAGSSIVEVHSWMRLRFDELAFGGGGKLCAFSPTWLPVEGTVVLVPALGEAGGIDVVVALREALAKRMRRIAYCLD